MAFASPTLTEHLARGVIGFAALTAAVLTIPVYPWLGVALMPVAVLALRGCPICWTTGLIEILAMRVLARREAVPRQRQPGP